MSKQGGKGAAAKGKKGAKAGADEKAEDVLQAVILADSFQDRFKPFTLEKPRCLLPLVGVPVIEYTLEFLAANGVQEVFIYCGAHNEEVETYIHESARWSPTSHISPFSSLEFIRVSDATSIGDFLRDLDKRGVIGGDFIVVHGDLVANVSLQDALVRHRARRDANRDNCMTMVLRSLGDGPHRAKDARVIQPVFAIEPSTGRCLQYEENHPLDRKTKNLWDPSLFEFPEFELRADLMDCGIDICTPEVLALWSESFDYELPRKNFLHGVLKDFELNGKMIYTEVLDDGYATRASNLGLYDCVSKDILERWTFPFVPDTNLVHGQTFKRNREGSCVEDGVVIARGGVVKKSVIGRSSTVGAGAQISKSVIGKRCKIGKNVTIEDSYIWDDTVIGDDSTVTRSIVAGHVTVGKSCQIPKGSLIGYNITLDDDTTLPSDPPARISRLKADKTLVDTDTSLVGPSGQGALYSEDLDSDDEDEDKPSDPSILQRTLFYSLERFNLSDASLSTLNSDESEMSDDEDPFVSHAADLAPRERLASFASDDSALAASSQDAFHSDAVNGLVDALRADDNEDFDSAKLEFMGLRLANNASDAAMRRAIAVAFSRRAAEMLTPDFGGLEPTKAADRVFNSKKGAVKFIREVGVGGEGTELQSEFALALQKALVGVSGLDIAKGGSLLAAMLQQLYNLDVLEEDGILAWWGDKRGSEGDTMARIREKSRVLVEWLENADEEDESEEEEDSDDE
ncbi:hypothetical protein OQA88_8838 [Cercophora sp. LCS_1]